MRQNLVNIAQNRSEYKKYVLPEGFWSVCATN